MKILETAYSKVNETTSEQLAFNEFARAAIDGFYKLHDKKADMFVPEIYKQLFRTGLFSVNVPESFGGMNGSFFDACNVISSVAYENPELSLCLVNHFSTIEILSKYLSEDNKKSFFSDLDSDCKYLSVGLPGRSSHGIYIDNYENSFFFVPEEHNSEAVLSVYGNKDVAYKYDNPAGLCRLNFIKIPCEADRILGKYFLKCGYDSLMDELYVYIDIGLSTLALGLTARLIAVSDAYANTRILFKKKLCAFPLIREKLARMRTSLYAMKALLFISHALLKAGTANVIEYSQFMKFYCSEKLFYTADECMNIHGANGYMEDSGIPYLWKSARAVSFLGTQNAEISHSLEIELQDIAVYEILGRPLPFIPNGELSEIFEQLLEMESALHKWRPLNWSSNNAVGEIMKEKLVDMFSCIIVIRALINFLARRRECVKSSENIFLAVMVFLVRDLESNVKSICKN